MALLALSGCSKPADSPTGEQTIIVWSNKGGPDAKGVQAQVREFEVRHPGWHVKLLDLGTAGMDPQKLMTSIVGKVPPDVVLTDRFQVADWASRGAFRPLDDLVARDKDKGGPIAKEYYPSAWQEGTFEGHVFGIPSVVDNRMLYYNRDSFRAAGLDPNKPPKTWSELKEYSKKLTTFDNTGRLVKAGFVPNYGDSWLYLFAFENDASFMSPDGKKCTLDSPAVEESLTFIKSCYDIVGGYEAATSFTGHMTGTGGDGFVRGMVAMKIDGNWNIKDMAEASPNADFGVAPPPVPDDRLAKRGRFKDEKDPYISWSGGACWALPKGVRHLEPAWEFVKFVTSAEGRFVEFHAQQRYQSFRGKLYIPEQAALIAVNEAETKEFRPKMPQYAAANEAHVKLMGASRFRPATMVGSSLWYEHVRAMERACSGLATPHEALAEGQTVVQRQLDQYFQRDQLLKVNLTASLGVIGFILLMLLGYWFRRQGYWKLKPLAKREAKYGWLFISPWVVGFLILTLGPMVASFFFSFTDFNILTEARWAGMRNYRELLGADRANVVKGFSNVAYLGLIGVPLSIFTGLSVALLLNGATRGIRVYRTLFYMPSIVPTVASTALWYWILLPDPSMGFLNAVWIKTITPLLGVAPPNWFDAEAWTKPSLILMGLWGAGSGMILWLAGLKGVPRSLYEAADIDGASRWKQFWAVTWPQLTPLIFFNLVIGVIGALQEFTRAYVVTQTDYGPGDSLLFPVYLLFRNAFGYFRMGYASALAWLIFAVILLLTLIQFKLAPKWVKYEVDG